LCLLLIQCESAWAQSTTIRSGTSADTATVSNGSLNVAITGGAGSGGTSQTDNAALSAVTPIGALYDTTPPAVTDGNVGAPVMDSSRRLIINCASGCSGSSFADNAAFTFGTTTITPIAGVFDDVSTNTATENSAAVARITAQKGLHVNIRNASGTEVGTAGAPIRIDPTGTTAQLVTNAGTFATQAAQSGTWTVQPGNTANTTPWLTTISQGGNAATVNGSGQLSITCANCSGSGASAVDDAAFTVATDSGAPAMGLFDDVTPDSVNEGDAGVLRMSANRNLYSTIRDAAGNERGANVNASNQLSVSVDNTVTVASHAVTNAGTFAVQAEQSGTWNVTNISGTVSLPTGAATSANQTTIIGHVDGLEGGLGASGDAAATAGSTGSLSAKQRLMTSQLDSIKTAVETLDNAISGAGFNVTQFGGTNVSVNNGAVSNGTIRVTVASDSTGQIIANGGVAHDGVDSGNPVKVGGKAIAHGTNPTAVAAADRTDWYFNRAGVPFVIGGHPNVQTIEAQVQDADGAQTDAAIVTVGAGTKIVVTRVTMSCDAGNTGPINAVVGFGTATMPSRAHTGVAGILHGFDGIPAGGGATFGDGSGILGVGADNEDLRMTMEDPAGGACSVSASYYTVPS